MRPEEAPPPGISGEDWANTPPAVRAWARAVEQRLARVEEWLNQTSRNSSTPPSSDPPTLTRPVRNSTGRKAGGQLGHPGPGRQLKAPEEVARLIEAKPTTCEQCRALLLGEDPQPMRHQVTEVPPVMPLVTEYRRHTLSGLVCGSQTQAPWPGDMTPGRFGPRLQATTGFVTGRIGASQREVQEILGTLFQTEIFGQRKNTGPRAGSKVDANGPTDFLCRRRRSGDEKTAVAGALARRAVGATRLGGQRDLAVIRGHVPEDDADRERTAHLCGAL